MVKDSYLKLVDDILFSLQCSLFKYFGFVQEKSSQDNAILIELQ